MSRTRRRRSSGVSEVRFINDALRTQYRYRIWSELYTFTNYGVRVRDLDAVVSDAKREFAALSRDGRRGQTDTPRSSGFKSDASETLRRANREFCRMVLSGRDYEDEPLPTRKLGKINIWNWW